jgi:DNA polymerase-4
VLDDIVDIVWERIDKSKSRGRTVTLKMRYSDFQIITRSRSASHFIDDKQEFAQLANQLLDQTLPLPLPIRLMGLGLSNMEGESASERPAKDDPQLSLL